jgi:hypothetical protein
VAGEQTVATDSEREQTPVGQASGDDVGDAGISMTTVLVMLVVLGVLVVGIFWFLPGWLGDSVIKVGPR